MDPRDKLWDVVVIGTGAGGAAAGYNLARLGRSVLFLERGSSQQSRWWPHRVTRARAQSGDPPVRVPIGCGAGGSTALFATVMDRFRPVDFTPRRFAPPAAAEALPETWPIEYDELAPFYQQAEHLFRVRGTQDQLATSRSALLEPPAPSAAESRLHQSLTDAGLHPYRIHYARESVPGCDGCFAKVCTRGCRNDAGRVALTPAIEDHNAHVLSECRVVRLEASGRSVNRALAVLNGSTIAIAARTFVLALHAILTPALLLRSGLGNSSGMVGRNLMLHASDWLGVRVDRETESLNARLRHGLAFNDFYVRDGVKLGNIHAHACDLPGPRNTTRGGMALFHTIVEDFPDPANRVLPVPGSDEDVTWEYNYSPELRARCGMLVDAFATALGERLEATTLLPAGQLNGSHACGTCRFGNDPRGSVLDRDNRVHDLDNVYVVDGSFFPSSGGINPSLTIVANSLRVSEKIARI